MGGSAPQTQDVGSYAIWNATDFNSEGKRPPDGFALGIKCSCLHMSHVT